ncbi:amidohydrolase family protein [Mariniblastus fucicola]|nr:amidohydrolase family protein [Mariniblastus fucicola]
MKRLRSIFNSALACSVGIAIVVAAVVPSTFADNSDSKNSESSATLYKASKVYTMDGDPLSPGQVLVIDGKIKAVAETVDLGGVEAESVDLGEGSVLMPGLVDAYSQTPLSSTGMDEITSEVTLDFQAIHSIDWDKNSLRRQLQAGTTTVNASPGTQNVLGGTAAVIKTMDHGDSVLVEDGAMLAAMCNDPASRNRSRSRPDTIYVRQPTNRMGVVWILRNTFSKAERSKDENAYAKLKQAVAADRPLMMVSRMSYDIETVGTLADEFGFKPIIVGGEEAYKVKEELVERDYPLVLKYDNPGTTQGAERSELCWNNPGILAEAGLTFAIAGDNLLEKARFARRFGLDADVALASITSTPAQIIGVSDRVGKIAAGYDADLIALSGEPLELTTSIRWVMVNGKTTTEKEN